MGLVDYSDSETSDVESAAPTPSAPNTKAPSRTAFPKVVDNPSGPRKIKVDLPATKPGDDLQDDAPPTKRARTAGTFGGFNSLLPAPKRPTAQSASKVGVSLKTSSEAAFSRVPPPVIDEESNGQLDGSVGAGSATAEHSGEPIEPKVVGKITKFKPLSVSNKKKSAPKKGSRVDDMAGSDAAAKGNSGQRAELVTEAVDPAPPAKPKRALFSVPPEEERIDTNAQSYQPMLDNREEGTENPSDVATDVSAPGQLQSNPNSVQSLTSDLNLTPAQRRQLFGRHAKTGDINIAHFNMENEYAANEQLRQAGEVVEHRAVKAIAPGKHSLQQLVNNARTQQDAMEDKWAEGKRDRGEGGAKYGWGR